MGHLITFRLEVLYLRSWAVSPPCVNIFQSSGSIRFACASSRKIICVLSSTKLLLNAFCLVIIAMYLAGIRPEMGVKRLVFPLSGSPTRHITFSLCCLMRQLSSRMKYSQKCAISSSLRLFSKIYLKYPGSGFLVCS